MNFKTIKYISKILILNLIIATAFAVHAAQPSDWNSVKCPGVEEIAREMLIAEFSGWRIATLITPCVEDSKVKSFKVVGQGYSTIEFAKPHYFVTDETIKNLTKYFKVSPAQGEYEITFEVPATALKTGKASKVKGTMRFSLAQGKLKSSIGCAYPTLFPKSLLIQKSCYTK